MIASISPAKMVLFKISREEQSRIYKGDEDCASPMWQGKGTTFIDELWDYKEFVKTLIFLIKLKHPFTNPSIQITLPEPLQCEMLYQILGQWQ